MSTETTRPGLAAFSAAPAAVASQSLEEVAEAPPALTPWIDGLAAAGPFWQQPWVPLLLGLAVILAMAAAAAIALALRLAAYHDSQTGLANRNLFLERLSRTLERRPDRLSAVLLLDLDRFKGVNESLGHSAGDLLLEKVAGRLRSLAGSRALLARLSGDEFAMLLADLEEVAEAERFAERVQESLSVPHDIGGIEVFCSASIGIVTSRGNYRRAEHMLRDADTAMYQAKRRSPGSSRLFAPAMHRRAVEVFRLESELRRALREEELELWYQPIYELATSELVGFEALLRWRHPERGVVLPAEFLAEAESTGLIVPIESWSLPEACRQLRAWQQDHPAASGLFVNVNLASQQFLQPQLPERVAGVLAASGLAARCLRIEITETAIMERSAALDDALRRLRELSVDLYIDDFGTGHSSLAYLERFPAAGLKIDRTFVRAIGGEEWGSGPFAVGARRQPTRAYEILRTVVRLGRSLGLEVVAEGIETPAQLEQLTEMGCHFGQGFHLGRPLESAAVAKLLAGSGRLPLVESSA